MPRRYFYKELVSTALYLPDGGRVKFDDIGDHTGLFATDDEKMGNELEAAVRSGKGGVSEITETEYGELIKKKRGLPSLNGLPPQQDSPVGSGPRVSLLQRNPFDLRPGGAAAVQAPITERSDTEGTPAPLRVPTKAEFRKPKLTQP